MGRPSPVLVRTTYRSGRPEPQSADEALHHGVVSRVVTAEQLDDVAMEMATKIANAPMIAVKLARKVIKHLADAELLRSMEDEIYYQTFLNRSDDFAEFRAARAEGRAPVYRGS